MRPNTVIDWRRRFEREVLPVWRIVRARASRGGMARTFASRCWRCWKNHHRRDKPSGTVQRWPGSSRPPCMRSGVCCARKASASGRQLVGA